MTDVQKLSTREVGVLAKTLVAKKIAEMGASTEISNGVKSIVVAKPRTGNRKLTIRVKSRRSGDCKFQQQKGFLLKKKLTNKNFGFL